MITIAQRNRGADAGKFFCTYNFVGMYYLHDDGEWKHGALGRDSTGYFESRKAIEDLLQTLGLKEGDTVEAVLP